MKRRTQSIDGRLSIKFRTVVQQCAVLMLCLFIFAALIPASSVFGQGIRVGPDGQVVESTLSGLIPVVSASGARFQAADGSQTGSWSKAESASVSVHGKVLPECQAVREPKLPFTARGQEPGWMITIDTSTIFLNTEFGAIQLNMPRTEPQATAEGILYSTEAEGRRLEVFIRPEVCADVATGMPHPYQVRFELDGQGHAGCGGDPNTLLTGGEWTVQSIDGVPVVENSEVTILFMEEWRVAGSASCNRFIGGYRLTGEGLSFSQLGTTMMACEKHLSQQESRFLEVLKAVVRFEISQDGRLVLHTPDQRRITGHR